MRVLLALVATTLLLTACGSDDELPDLDGTTYSSTDVSGHDLVEGSTVTLSFEDGTMAVKAGCNTQTGAYEVSDGRLQWSGPAASTTMACPTADLADQDQWLAGLFTDGMDAKHDGDTLTLTSGDVTMTLSSS